MRRLRLLSILTVGFGIASMAYGQDWPQWRGPNRDGAIASFSQPASWPEQLNQQWQVEVGSGYATPLVVGDRVYIFTRQNEDEVLQALDPETGESIWRAGYPASFEMNSSTASHGPGPKSTPTYADGRIFTLGISGIVTAFDAGTGRQLWQHPARSAEPLYHTSMSPAVDGDVMILHVGGPGDTALTAFDVATGEPRWQWEGDSPAYGSPMVAELEGTRQVVTFTNQNLVGVALATGELLWSRPFVTPSDTTSQTPIIYGDTVIQAGRENGITGFRVIRGAGGWTTEDIWHTDEVSLHMTNGVEINGMLFGLSHLNSGQYFGLDLDSGEVLWLSEGRQAQNAAILRAGDTIFSLEDDAEMLVLNASRTGLDPIRRYEVASSATWTQPAISGNAFYVKDVNTLALWTLD
jgi:outer membrane protein assembly factor BamB